MFNFRVQKDLRDRWFVVLVQHLNLFLMPLRHQFDSATVYLYSTGDGAGKLVNINGSPPRANDGGDPDDRLYTCAVKITGMEKIACHNRDPLLAIAQAMARTKRTLTRQAQLRDVTGIAL